MTLDVSTLYHLSVVISALLGVLLLVAWLLQRNAPALAWWAAGFIVVAIGLGKFAARGALHDLLSIVTANMVLFLGAGLFWTGARVFEGKRPSYALLAAGPVAWGILCAIPAFYGDINARVMAASAILGACTLATAWELWRGRTIPLISRWPAILLLVFHGGLFFVRIALTAVAPVDGALPGASGGWFLVLHYEVILYQIALAFCFFALAKERQGQTLVIA